MAAMREGAADLERLRLVHGQAVIYTYAKDL